MIIVCSDCGKSLTRKGKLYTFPELFTKLFSRRPCNGAMFSDLQLNASRLQRSLTKATEKSNRWLIPFLCQPSVELVYNICVRDALVDRHDKQIRTNLSRVPLAYRLSCTIYMT